MDGETMEIWEGPTQKAETDFSALLQAAIERKRERELKKAQAAVTLEENDVPKGEKLTWKVTPQQITLINLCDREALDKFYFDNAFRLKSLAGIFFRRSQYLKSIISIEDLMQQLYVDFRCGMLKLKPFDKAIGRAIFNSFQYAAVGGIDHVYIYEEKQRKCRNMAN